MCLLWRVNRKKRRRLKEHRLTSVPDELVRDVQYVCSFDGSETVIEVHHTEDSPQIYRMRSIMILCMGI